jgi:hypothetical protein
MSTISIFAHFDGTQIRLDEPYSLRPNARLLVTLLPETEEEREAWLHLSAQKLIEAYSDDEPEYPLSAVRDSNIERAARTAVASRTRRG